MPNWCENELTVSGNGIAVSAFLNAVKGESELDFGKVIPEPEGIREGRDPGLDWRNDHWGTKWNACDCVLIDDQRLTRGRKVTIGFDTAWAPPTPVVEEIIRKYRMLTVTLRYWEGGMQYKGVLKGKGGEVLKREQGEYKGRRGG